MRLGVPANVVFLVKLTPGVKQISSITENINIIKDNSREAPSVASY